MGSLMGGLQQPQQFVQEQQQRIEQLTGMIEKQQQRMTTLLQSQPGMFVDENDENIISPERLAYLSGVGIPMDPSAIIKRAKTTEDKAYTLELAGELIDIGVSQANPVAVAKGLSMISAEQGLGWSDEFVQDLSVMDQSRAVNALHGKVSTASLVTAIKESSTSGKPLFHKDITSGLQPYNEADAVSPDDQIKALAVKSALWFQHEWMNEGDNRALYERDPVLAFDIAFAGRPADKAAVQQSLHSFRAGDEMSLIQMKAFTDAVAFLPEMQALMSSALTMNPSDPGYAEAMANTLFEVANGFDRIYSTVTSMAAISVQTDLAKGIGERAVQNYTDVLGAGDADTFGFQVVNMAHRMAQADGEDFHYLSPVEQRAYLNEAERTSVEILRRQRAKAATLEDPTPEPEARQSDIEDYMQGETVRPPEMEAPTAEETPPMSAPQLKALARDEGTVREALDLVKKLPSGVKLGKADSAAVREVNYWLSLDPEMREAQAADPDFQDAMGRVLGVAAMGVPDAEVVRLHAERVKRGAKLAELNSMSPARRERAMSLPEYVKAKREDWIYRSLPQDRVVKVLRESRQKFEREAGTAMPGSGGTRR
jgi:hypothetical protein